LIFPQDSDANSTLENEKYGQDGAHDDWRQVGAGHHHTMPVEGRVHIAAAPWEPSRWKGGEVSRFEIM